MLLEVYPKFIKEHSPKIDYMEELRKAVIQNHIQTTSRFMATTAIKAYNDDAKPQNTFIEKIISWTSFALEQIINWVKGKPYEEYNKRKMRIKVEEVTNLISPILGTRLEKFDDYVFPELRAELMKVLYKTLVRLVNESKDKVRHAIIEGVNKVIDTIPQSYVEKYAIRSEGEQININ